MGLFWKKKPESAEKAALREKLSPEEYHVTQEAGTEKAFTGRYWDTKTEGVYKCIVCDQELFSSTSKYDSGTGWPSFYEAISEKATEKRADYSLFAKRTEVVCANCEAHLGHVFDDGPEPTGDRFCMNSAALRLDELGPGEEKPAEEEEPRSEEKEPGL